MIMFPLVASDAVRISEGVINLLWRTGLFVILPIVIVSLLVKSRKHEVNKRTEVMLKAVESGTQLSPGWFEQSFPEKQSRRLTAGITWSVIGIFLTIAAVVMLVLLTKAGADGEGIAIVVSLGAVLAGIALGVGVGNWIAYSVAKKNAELFAGHVKEDGQD